MKRLLYPSLSLFCLLGSMCLLSGCSASLSMPDTPIDNPGNSSGSKSLAGYAMGGQQPIIAAHVYMFEALNGTCYGLCNPNVTPITYGTPPISLLGASGGYTCQFPLVSDGTNCYYKTTGTDPSGAPSNLIPSMGNGAFNLNNTYQCTPGAQVWLLSLSGYTTTSGGAEALNPYAGLMASLGKCPDGTNGTVSGNFSSDSYIFMNELSTVAMAYAIAGFAGPTTSTHYGTSMVISTDSTNLNGFNQAFANAAQLYNIFQNNPLTNQPDQSAPHTTPVGTGIPPYYLLNTIADMLASCINSAILSAPTNCANLFSGAYGNSTQTTDTASVAIQIAQNPNAPGLDELLALSTTSGPWFPNNTSPSAPYAGAFPDLTAAITYTVAASGGNISGNITPSGIGVDGSGDVFTTAFNADGYMVKVSPLGVVLSSTSASPTYINDSTSLALDSTGLIWADGFTNGNVYEVSSVSTLSSVTDFADVPPPPLKKGIDHPVAADTTGNVFFADSKLSELYWVANGTVHNPIVSSTCTSGVDGVAADANNNLWVTSGGSGKTYTDVCHISESSSPTVLASAGNGSTKKVYEADGVAVDSGNNGWIYDNSDDEVYEIGSTTSTVSGPFNGAGLDSPTGIAIDGLNNIFLINSLNSEYSGGSISEFNKSGIAVSPATYGFQAANVATPAGIAIDISGNVWIANYGNTNLVEVIGLAAPTAGPLSAGKPGTRP